MNAIKYFNTIYSYIAMIVNHDDPKSYSAANEEQFKVTSNIKNLNEIENIYDIESDGGYSKLKYDIESDGGITKKHIIFHMLMNERGIALDF